MGTLPLVIVPAVAFDAGLSADIGRPDIGWKASPPIGSEQTCRQKQGSGQK
jgi:hypothetical protein